MSSTRAGPDIQLLFERTFPGWPQRHYLHTWETCVGCWPPGRRLHLLSHHALWKLSLGEPELAVGSSRRRVEPRGVGGQSTNCLVKMPSEQDESVGKLGPDRPRSSAALSLVTRTHTSTHTHSPQRQRTTLKVILHSSIIIVCVCVFVYIYRKKTLPLNYSMLFYCDNLTRHLNYFTNLWDSKHMGLFSCTFGAESEHRVGK